MTSPLTSSNPPMALVLAGGTLPTPVTWAFLLACTGPVIAADGGLRHARVLGVKPDLIVGDLDSVEPHDLARFAHVPVERHPRGKDELDLELALAAAWRMGGRSAAVAGAFGGRFDQSLATLLIAAEHARRGREVVLFGGTTEARLLAAGAVLRSTAPTTSIVSLLALSDDCVVSTQGVAFPLAHAPLPYGTGLGLSNSVRSDLVEVEVHRGMAALVLEHGEGQPREAIWGAQAARIEAALAAADPDLADLVGRVAYDEVFARAGLDLATRELLAVALLTAQGGVEQLPTHLRGALRVGASERQLREAILQAAVFVGFPKALAAMRALQRFVERERESAEGEEG